MEFEISEKLAMVHLIDSVIVADGEVHNGEINALTKLMTIIDFDSNFLIQARSIDIEQSVNILKDMPEDKKSNLAQILKDVAISDGYIHEKESDVIRHVFSEIGLSKKA
ncbi:TerB family tellurite resistance protein [Maribacter sp. 1_MG-2023]|uniref:TerB family tellurite resistance protein n=1 Tax=Maribacter sp. 1_MG-2023 TaxID=3062677 RepID=UPI0026E258A7|nr:TerB family tellurite resistance protein [Maribacter sp. 1_MG-2023]MDO6470761.1 TerB family tellurite resistance protein [Maribacter sp. 1_MG-2023]